ncbi:hypothetical protein B296_00057550 [Ensete ventricosum]|uniref:Kinesin motor domain-containing protein n=1 Tax=Ensete ventricosum TaxID=4639 RepID=A0A426XQF4_ENSVE|nr:hypothetical protein B296_00057550 [Ensete ventricosum]
MDLSVEKVNCFFMIYFAKTSRGKTYTMWGPPNALLEDAWSRTTRGLALCAYERLFSRIEKWIKVDVPTGVCVDYLTEEYVCMMM